MDMIKAISRGNLNKVKRFIDKGINLNKELADGWSYLQKAVNMHDYSMTKMMLENGATVNYAHPTLNWTALTIAVSYDLSNIVELLIEYDADIHRLDSNNENYLYVGIENDSYSVLQPLITAGIGVDSRNTHNDWTPLHLAANQGKEKVIELLLKNKADKGLKDGFLRTPLSLAVINNNFESVKLLIEDGANINIINSNKVHLFEQAVVVGNIDTIELLVDSVVLTNKSDINGIIARKISTNTKNIAIRWNKVLNIINKTKYGRGR